MAKNKEKIQFSFYSRNYNNYFQNITSNPSNTNTKHTDKITDQNYEKISKEGILGNDKHCVMKKFGFISSYERSKRKPINVNIIINSNKTNHYKAIIKTNNYNDYYKDLKRVIPKSEPKITKTKKQIKSQEKKPKMDSSSNINKNQKNIKTPNNKNSKKINSVSPNYRRVTKINNQKLKTAITSKTNILKNKIKNHINKLNSTNSAIDIQKENISSNNIKPNKNIKNIKTTKNRNVISKINNNKQYFNTSKIKKKQISKIGKENPNKTPNKKISDLSKIQSKDDDTERKAFKILSMKNIDTHKSCVSFSQLSDKKSILNLKINSNILNNFSFQIQKINYKFQKSEKKIQIKHQIKKYQI